MADINVNLKLNYGSNPTGPLKEVQAEVKGLEKSFAKISALDVFKGAFGANVAIKGLELVGQALGALVNQFSAGIEAAKEAEQAQAAFAFSIADTEKDVSKATAAFDEFAKQLSNTTGFEDDLIVKTGAVIGTLTQLSGTALQGATKAAADLSAALGIDLEQAATLVAKAANGNTAAFGKLGIEIKKGNTDAETFANTLQALERFQGAAAQKSQTFAGAQARLSNAFGNLQEELGNTVVKNQAFVNALNAVQSIFIRVTDIISKNGKGISEALGNGLLFVVDTIGVTLTALDFLARSVTQAFNIIQLGIQTSIRGILTVLEPLRGVSDVVDNVLSSFDDGIKDTSKSIDEAFTKDTLLQDFATATAEVSNGIKEGIGQSAKTAADSIKGNLTPAFQELSEEQKKLGQQGKDLATSLLGSNSAEKLAQQSQALAEARAQDLITEQTFLDSLGVAQDAFRQREIEALIAQNALLAEVGLEKNQVEIDANQSKIDAILAQDFASSEAKKTLEQKNLKARQDREKAEAELDRKRLSASAELFGGIAAIARTAGKDGFEVAKTAATAEAIIQGFLAVQTALASAPPPFGAIAAIGVGLKAAANISSIQATNLATGITSVPAGFRNDTFPANLSSGERVLSVEQNKDLKQFMNEGGGGSNEMLQVIANKLDRLSNTIVVNIGEKEVFNVLRDGVNSGRAFA